MKNFIVLLLFSFSCSMLPAQDLGMLSAHYHIALPLGKFDDFQPDNSYRGFSIEYHHKLKHHFQIGGLIGYHIFNKTYPRTTYEFENGSVTMKQWHYTHVLPIAAVVRYGLFEDERVSPFIGIGNGLYFVRQEIWAGLDEFLFEEWHYGLFPEIGMRISIINMFGLILSSRYNFIVRGQISDKNNEHMHFWDFNVGVYVGFKRGENKTEEMEPR